MQLSRKLLPGVALEGVGVHAIPDCVDVAVRATDEEYPLLATNGIEEVLLVPPCVTVSVVNDGVPNENVLTDSVIEVDWRTLPAEPWIVIG